MSHTHSKSSLFLLELIIGILIMVVASTICIKVFFGASMKSTEAKNLTSSQELASGAAELIREEGADLGRIQEYYPDSSVKSGILDVYYDKNWDICTEKNKCYAMSITVDRSGKFVEAYITLKDNKDKKIYGLEADTYKLAT